MRVSRHVTWAVAALVLAVLTVGLGTASGSATAPGPKSLDPALVQKLKDTARGSVTISTKKHTTFATFVRAGRNGDLYPKQTGPSPNGKARGFVREFGGVLGSSGADEFTCQPGAMSSASSSRSDEAPGGGASPGDGSFATLAVTATRPRAA